MDVKVDALAKLQALFEKGGLEVRRVLNILLDSFNLETIGAGLRYPDQRSEIVVTNVKHPFNKCHIIGSAANSYFPYISSRNLIPVAYFCPGLVHVDLISFPDYLRRLYPPFRVECIPATWWSH